MMTSMKTQNIEENDMIHGERFFVIQENQVIWDAYINNIMSVWDAENKERLEKESFSDEEKAENIKKLSGYSEKGKDDLTPYKFEYRKKKMSVQQYKPIVLEFEAVIGKSFNDISVKDIENFLGVTTKEKRINHFYAFLRECVSTGLIKNKDIDFLLALLPDVYKGIGDKIIEAKVKIDNSCEGRKKGLIRCPFCGREKEALAENWMLIQIVGESEKYVACKECEGEDGKYKY